MASLFGVALFSQLVITSSVQAIPAISQEASNPQNLPAGTLVSLTVGEEPTVDLAHLGNSRYLFGVITQEGTSLGELSSDLEGAPIATIGDASTLVSTINGDIKTGDVIAVSSIAGVGAKVQNNEGSSSLGIALADFSEASPTAKTLAAQTSEGQIVNYIVGSIPVRVAVNDYYIEQAATSNLLVTIGERLIGRPVSQMQVLVSAILLFASIVVGGYTIYGAVHGSFISIGRNPLAGTAVMNSLFFVTMISAAVVVIGAASAYVVLLL